jgi:hypothetical protein
MTIYITKYALKKGIVIVTKDDYEEDGDWVKVKPNLQKDTFFYIGQDVFFNREEAVKKAQKMKEKKISSLERELARLKTLDIESL